MIADSAILDAFFEECEDLLTALTDGLAEMREGQTDSETVNAVFRAVHSIKGAAGAFSMHELVGFAHTFETVLDAVRAERLEPDEELLRLLQRAGDILSDLVDNAREDVPADRQRVDPVLAELEGFLGDDAAPEEDFVFEALALDFEAPQTAGTYQLTFHPSEAFYTSGNDPLLLLRALQDLGAATVTCDASALPKQAETFQYDHGYLTWTVTLQNQQNDLAIREIFEFVDDLCQLEIRDITSETPEFPGLPLPTEERDPVLPDALTPEDTTPEVQPQPSKKKNRSTNKPAATLRVDPERVDRLINAVGELIINQSVISQRIEEANLPSSSDLHADLDDYKLLAREIQEGVMAIRAQPVRPLFQRMLRIAREAAEATGKDVEIVTEGETTEVDKIVVERLADPLTHMIRNAVDHGIETPATRLAAGKSNMGLLKLRANQSSGSIVIQIIDDGAGLNRPKIREIAVTKRLISEEDQLSESEIDHLLFAPGFSTATEVTNLSGRGVGMDVVKTAITDLGGKIAISSVTGKGDDILNHTSALAGSHGGNGNQRQ